MCVALLVFCWAELEPPSQPLGRLSALAARRESAQSPTRSGSRFRWRLLASDLINPIESDQQATLNFLTFFISSRLTLRPKERHKASCYTVTSESKPQERQAEFVSCLSRGSEKEIKVLLII